MLRRPPRSTRTDTLFPYTTLFRADDEVLGTILHLDVAIGMADREVAGVKPAAAEGFLGRRRVLEIALHHGVAAQHELAHGRAVARHRDHRAGVDQDRKSTRLNSSH